MQSSSSSTDVANGSISAPPGLGLPLGLNTLNGMNGMNGMNTINNMNGFASSHDSGLNGQSTQPASSNAAFALQHLLAQQSLNPLSPVPGLPFTINQLQHLLAQQHMSAMQNSDNTNFAVGNGPHQNMNQMNGNTNSHNTSHLNGNVNVNVNGSGHLNGSHHSLNHHYNHPHSSSSLSHSYGSHGHQTQSSNPCNLHLQGYCKFGATCRYSHASPAGGAAANMTANMRPQFATVPPLSATLQANDANAVDKLEKPKVSTMNPYVASFQPKNNYDVGSFVSRGVGAVGIVEDAYTPLQTNVTATPTASAATNGHVSSNGHSLSNGVNPGYNAFYNGTAAQSTPSLGQRLNQTNSTNNNNLFSQLGSSSSTNGFYNKQAGGHIRIHHDLYSRDVRRERELFGEVKTGIQFDKYDSIPVETTGNDVVPPIDSFEEVDIPTVLKQNIQLAHYTKPTPIQKHSLPIALQGRDIMACAQTGSGKTAGFLFPLICSLITNGRPSPNGGYGRNRKYCPIGLILAPTRELATQILDEALKFTYCTSIRSCVVYGGQDIKHQFRELDRGCDILVATPGRLTDFLERGRITLNQVTYLVFDEADRMLDMGFEPQIRNIVLQQDMSAQRQTLMFSATFPKEIQKLAQDFLYNYVFIAVGRVGSSSDFITQHIEFVEDDDKKTILLKLLPSCGKRTLVFVERKKSADLLETFLLREGYSASSIHGDRSQNEREHALALFRNGRCNILVATDVAARGLDISDVTDVINFDMSNTIEDYVHRIGRTGRCGNSGNAWTFLNAKNNHLFDDLFDTLLEAKQTIPPWLSSVVQASRQAQAQKQQRKLFGSRDFRKGQYGSYGSQRGGRGGFRGGRGGHYNSAQRDNKGHANGNASAFGSNNVNQLGGFNSSFGLNNGVFGSMNSQARPFAFNPAHRPTTAPAQNQANWGEN